MSQDDVRLALRPGLRVAPPVGTGHSPASIARGRPKPASRAFWDWARHLAELKTRRTLLTHSDRKSGMSLLPSSLTHAAIAHARGWAANSINARVRQAAEIGKRGLAPFSLTRERCLSPFFKPPHTRTEK